MAEAPLGFVGLGVMGARMASRLVDAGHHLAVNDARPEAMEELVARGAIACKSPADVAGRAEIVFVSLPTPEIVVAVVSGENGLLTGGAMRTYVDLSTTGPPVAAQVGATLADAGVVCIDAPVSGGAAGAAAGTLTVMAAGDAAAFAALCPIFEVFGKTIVHVGAEPGQGQLAKVLNNLLSASAIAITAEAMAVGVRGGLDPGTLLDVVNASSGRNTASADKFPNRVLTRTFDAGFRLELMTKDVQLALAEAARQHVPMPVGATVAQLWSLAEAVSEPDADCTDYVRLVEGWAHARIGDAGAGDD